MSSRSKKWLVGIIVFLVMWLVWGFDETANIVNNIGWFGMVAAAIAWTESSEARKESQEMREKIHKLVEELHHHNVPK